MMQRICAGIARIIESHVDGLVLDESKYDVRLTELGVNSVAFIQIIVEIEDVFLVEIPDEYLLLSKMETVNKMAEIVLLSRNN